jgi:TPR repeat protein
MIKDELKAMEWYQKAAEQGYPDAQRNLNTIRKRLKL